MDDTSRVFNELSGVTKLMLYLGPLPKERRIC
jgi:hypothetical protein